MSTCRRGCRTARPGGSCSSCSSRSWPGGAGDLGGSGAPMGASWGRATLPGSGSGAARGAPGLGVPRPAAAHAYQDVGGSPRHAQLRLAVRLRVSMAATPHPYAGSSPGRAKAGHRPAARVVPRLSGVGAALFDSFGRAARRLPLRARSRLRRASCGAAVPPDPADPSRPARGLRPARHGGLRRQLPLRPHATFCLRNAAGLPPRGAFSWLTALDRAKRRGRRPGSAMMGATASGSHRVSRRANPMSR